jgi:hypothetical protein
MARIDWVHTRLLNWQRWKLTQGSGVLGYSAMRWQEPVRVLEPYAEAPVPTNAIEASETDDAVQRLPGVLLATVRVYYLGKLDPGNRQERHAACERDQVNKLCISKATMHARLGMAHKALAEHWNARRERAQRERARVEGTIAANRPASGSFPP